MPASAASIASLQRRVWSGSLPLEIRLAPADCRTYEDSEPYLVHHPRLSYLAFLLPDIYAFFAQNLIDPSLAAHDAWLEFEAVPLKWHYPLGLLFDLYSGAEPISFDQTTARTLSQEESDALQAEPLPWRLTVHYSDFPADQLIQVDADGRMMLDAYINGVKEADFIRNGTARAVMSLSKDDSDKLWKAVDTHDLDLFNTINNKLIHPAGLAIKHVPIKIYLPTSASIAATPTIPEESGDEGTPKAGHFRVVQTLIPLYSSARQPQTVGTALNGVLPAIFPSRRNPLLAQPVLHGAVLPMSAPVEELARAAAYTDGFLHIAVVMLG